MIWSERARKSPTKIDVLLDHGAISTLAALIYSTPLSFFFPLAELGRRASAAPGLGNTRDYESRRDGGTAAFRDGLSRPKASAITAAITAARMTPLLPTTPTPLPDLLSTATEAMTTMPPAPATRCRPRASCDTCGLTADGSAWTSSPRPRSLERSERRCRRRPAGGMPVLGLAKFMSASDGTLLFLGMGSIGLPVAGWWNYVRFRTVLYCFA